MAIRMLKYALMFLRTTPESGQASMLSMGVHGVHIVAGLGFDGLGRLLLLCFVSTS